MGKSSKPRQNGSTLSFTEAQKLLVKQFDELKRQNPGVPNAYVLTQLMPLISISWERKYPTPPLMYEVRVMVNRNSLKGI